MANVGYLYTLLNGEKGMYQFNENTPPKEIIKSAMLEIATLMIPYGYKFLPSKNEITKKTDDFKIKIYSQSCRWNGKGESAGVWLHCSVTDNKEDIYYWAKTLACSNSKQDQFHKWELYGEENNKKSLNEIISIITTFLLPFFIRFTDDFGNLVNEVAEKGFCAFGSEQVYDAGYHIPIDFLEKFGTKEQLAMAFQNYYNRHELNFVRRNLQTAIELIQNGKEVTKNGEIDYAKYIVEHNINLVF